MTHIVLESQPLPLQVTDDGVIRVTGTRITLDTVVGAFKSGATPEQIAQDYPVLNLVDIYEAIAFYLRHSEAVETYLVEQAQQGQQLRQEMEARFDPQGIRDRLMARRAQERPNGASSVGG